MRNALLVIALAFSLVVSACGTDATDSASASANSELEVIQAELELQQAEIERLQLEQQAAESPEDDDSGEAGDEGDPEPVTTTTKVPTTEPEAEREAETESPPTTTIPEPPKQLDCDQPSFRIDGQDIGLFGGLQIEAGDDGQLSLWTTFGDTGVSIPLNAAGEPGSELSTVSESGYRLTTTDAHIESTDGGWQLSGLLNGPEGDSYDFETCLVPDPSGTWIQPSRNPSGIEPTSWEMFDLVTSFESITNVRSLAELGEYERIEVEEILALGDGVEAQDGFVLAQRIAENFNQSQAGLESDIRQHATPLLHVWNTPPVSYVLIEGGGDDSIQGIVLRLDMEADAATGWAIADASVRSLCWRGVSDGLCL